MAMTEEERYNKLLGAYLKLRLAETMLAEVMDELKEGNEVLRELQRERWLSDDGKS